VLATFAYDDLGRRVSLTRGSGGATSYGFDAASRLSSLTQDAAGTADDLANGFAYNPASQIASETTTNAAYDGTHPANFTNAYASDLLNKYTTAAGATVTHDARGNLTFDGTESFAYDAANRLTSASGGGVSATLSYDPASRLHEVAGTATTKFLYDGADLIAEYDGSGTLLRRHVHGPGLDEPLVWYEGAGTADRRFLHADPRGSVIAVANSAGTVTAKNRYDAHGAPAAGNLGRFQYTGQIWLAEAGLYHYKARAYHPGLGRFLQTAKSGLKGRKRRCWRKQRPSRRREN